MDEACVFIQSISVTGNVDAVFIVVARRDNSVRTVIYDAIVFDFEEFPAPPARRWQGT